MPNVYFGVVAVPETIAVNSPTESDILKILQKADKTLLFFPTKLQAVKYCEIANKPKFLFLEPPQTAIFGSYESIADTNLLGPPNFNILLQHQSAKAFFIIKAELDINLKEDSRFEYPYYIFSYALDTPNALREPQHHYITLSEKHAHTLEDPAFHAEGRQIPAWEILSFCHAKLYQNGVIQDIAFSPQQQKLTQLRNYVLDPTSEKLNIVTSVIAPDELHKLFGYLINEKLDYLKLLTGKENLISAYVNKENSTPQPHIDPVATPNNPPEKKPVSLGWKIAFVVTLGLAWLVYKYINYLKTNKTPVSKPMEPEISKLTPLKPTPHFQQKTFDFNLVQKGMYQFWQEQAARSLKANHRSGGEKASLYAPTKPDEASYLQHLIKKQDYPLSLNHQGELRKKIEFKDKNTAQVTGTAEQIKRWGLYAEYGASGITRKELDTELEKSWYASTKIR